MKKLVFVFVAMFVFSGLAMAETSGVRCKMLDCSSQNEANMTCYGEGKVVRATLNAKTTLVTGVDLYNQAVDSKNIRRNGEIVLGASIVKQPRKLTGFKLFDICENVTAFCKFSKVNITEDECKVSRMMFVISPVPASQICEIDSVGKKTCI